MAIKKKYLTIMMLVVIIVVILSATKDDRKALPYGNVVAKNDVELKYQISQQEKGIAKIKASLTNKGEKEIRWIEDSMSPTMDLYIKTEKFSKRKEEKKIGGGNIDKRQDGGGSKSGFMYAGGTYSLPKDKTLKFEEEIPLVIQKNKTVSELEFQEYEGKVVVVIYNPEYEVQLQGVIEDGILMLKNEKIVIGANKRKKN